MNKNQVKGVVKDIAGKVQEEARKRARQVRRELHQSSGELGFCDEEFRVNFQL
jgi:uncharacterized protein YjbJ (UPF0337 family)